MSRVPRLGAVAAVILIFCGFAASAEITPDPSQTQDQSAVKPKLKADDPKRNICKTEPILGTRLGGTTTCHTRAEWDEISRRAQSRLSDAFQQSNHVNPNGH